MKTWSYKTITENAEKEIRALMIKSKTADSEFEQRLRNDWAYGVFLGWKKLTMGWMKDGDIERLKSLCDYENSK